MHAYKAECITGFMKDKNKKHLVHNLNFISFYVLKKMIFCHLTILVLVTTCAQYIHI